MIALGLRDQIASVWTGAIDDEPLWKKVPAGQLPVMLGSGTSEIRGERMLDRKPDVIVVGASQSQDMLTMQRARDLGMHTVPSLSRIESTPLGRAEWLKALAAVFNLESKANDVYNDLAGHYRIVSLRARATVHRPRVFWGSTYAAGEWTVARNSFQARLIEDAGAVNPLADQGPTVMVKSGPQLIVERAGDAEYWITENGSILPDHSTSTVPGTSLGALQAVRARHVYHLCRPIRVENNACDYYQTGTYRPDLVLEDLVWLLHPELESDHLPRFLFQLPPIK
jgi:iron complex transport system substrate-binding protein